jgi:predicted NACHT family NTPase
LRMDGSNPRRIRQFIADWFREICGRATGVADRTAGEMIADVGLNEYVSVFTQNPLLLTAVCILYQDNKRLPEQRADLYGRVVANLLYRRFLDPNDADKLYNFELYLMKLAFHLQARNVRVFEESEAKE